LLYAANGPEKDTFRGVVSQSPLIKVVKPPAAPVVFLLSILSKIIPNFPVYRPVPVFPPGNGRFNSREKISLATLNVQRNTTKIHSFMEQGHYCVSIQWLPAVKIYSYILQKFQFHCLFNKARMIKLLHLKVQESSLLNCLLEIQIESSRLGKVIITNCIMNLRMRGIKRSSSLLSGYWRDVMKQVLLERNCNAQAREYYSP